MALRAVLTTAVSGPLARFGRAGANALQLWADRAGVHLEVIDAHPSATAAIRSAEAARPDVVFGPYGAGPARAATAAAGGVIWNHGGATAALARPAYPRVVNVLSPVRAYLGAVLETIAAQGLAPGSQVLVLHAGTGFGREAADGAAHTAHRLGLRLHAVGFAPGRAHDVLGRVPPADVLLSAGSFDDDVAVLRWSAQRRWRAVGSVAAGVDDLQAAIGAGVERLYGPCQWFDDGSDDPADGPDAAWFGRHYRDATGAEAPYPAAAAFAAGVLWRRCVSDAATAAPPAVLAAAETLDTTSLFGRFRIDPVTGLQAGHRIRVVQWRRGRRIPVG